jgi:hypothetical protein
MRSKRIVSANWTIGALMVLSAGDDPASAPYQRAILPLNEESMNWCWLAESNSRFGLTKGAFCH